MLTLAACEPAPKPHYNGLDLTGGDYKPDFKLSGPDGKVYTLADFKGKYVMVFFGFTQCPDVCPTALSRALEIRQKLGPDADKLQVIFISIDPERDTPELLGEYMRAFDPSFLGLRTDPKATAQTAFNYKVFYRRVPSGSSYTMDHTAISYVLDTEGRMRLGLKHQLTGDECVQDIKTLMQSKYTL
ncbi:redoxin domain-containing protein [Janthinobacterium rivuli]|nr:redoxin domain-containing protein [Janthinobacterium sp. FT68W]